MESSSHDQGGSEALLLRMIQLRYTSADFQCFALSLISTPAMILLSAGSNARGQLATGDQEDAHEFKRALFEVDSSIQSSAPGEILQLACGANHTLILLRNDSDRSLSVYGTGDGSRGQLGVRADVREGTHHFKQLVIMGDSPPPGEVSIVQASWETSFVVVRSTPHDRILSFGSNEFGLLGTGDITTATVNEVRLDHLVPPSATSLQVTHLKAGPRHVLAVLQYIKEGIEREMLIGWGAGRHGQLEIRNPEEPSFDSRKVNGPRQVPLPIRITDWTYPISVVDMSVGNQHALLLLSNGSIVQVGSNSKSQLLSESRDRMENCGQVRCSWNNSFVGISDSESLLIRSYGRNEHGQLGRTEGGDRVVLPSPLKIWEIVCGSEHCLVKGTDQDS
jgi:protein ATS1